MTDYQKILISNIKKYCADSRSIFGTTRAEIEEVLTAVMHEMDGHDDC